MPLDIEKIKAAALINLERGHVKTVIELPTFIKLITWLEAAQNSDQHNFDRWQACQEKLEAAESELNVCNIEYGDVRDSYLHYKEKYESAEKDAAKYQELIYVVGHKFPGETRHETALRYIKYCEEPKSASAAMKESA